MQTHRRNRTPNASFFVRLWLEVNGETGQWRGQVRHIQSGEVAYFVDAQDLLAFLAAHDGMALIQKRKEVNHDVIPDHADPQSGKLPY